MNKKILVSLSVIAAAAAIVIGGTTAYFSDTELSGGNTFTAGAVDLKIDSQCHYNGGNCPDQNSNWQLTDLQNGVHKFFNFDDIKPGAWGENTISLHVYNNPSWVWMRLRATENTENACTEPESDVDTTCGNPGAGEGELAPAMSFLVWQDIDGDNVYEAGEKILHNGSLDGLCKVVPVNGNDTCNCDTIAPLTGEKTYYVGVQWCLGSFDSNYQCDGTLVDNRAQTDSMKMDVEFVAVQAQNNPGGNGGPVCAIP